jgi:hypothetical protein
MVKYTHAVVRRILSESGKETDELVYAVDVNHAMALAHQGMASGWVNVAIIALKEPVNANQVANTG